MANFSVHSQAGKSFPIILFITGQKFQAIREENFSKKFDWLTFFDQSERTEAVLMPCSHPY